MALLSEAKGKVAYARIGMMGFPGGGKTFTAALIAIGLAKQFGKDKPVAMYDSEKGSDWIVPLFEEAEVKLLVAKCRAFRDLIEFTKEAQKKACVAFVDSVTHPWGELIEAGQKRFKTKKLAFHHWGQLKPEWAVFADWVLNVPMHVIVCGRAGWEYETVKDEEEGGYDVIKKGIKMRAEAQFGFEPTLVLEMEPLKKSALSGDMHERGLIHRCHILKDRSQALEDVGHIDNPTYESFRPFVSLLTPGSREKPVDTESSSEDMLDDPEKSRGRRIREVNICLENIKAEFIRWGLEGRKAEILKEKVALLEDCFGTASWTAVESMELEMMQGCLKTLRERLREKYGKKEDGEETKTPCLKPVDGGECWLDEGHDPPCELGM